VIEGAALAALYWAFGDLVFSQLPYSTPESWWVDLWASRRIGVLAWFQALNVLGAVAAAIPVAFLVRWRFAGRRLIASVLIAVPTAGLILFGYPCCRVPGLGWSAATWMDQLVLVTAVLASLPMLVFVIGRVRLTMGWSGP